MLALVATPSATAALLLNLLLSLLRGTSVRFPALGLKPCVRRCDSGSRFLPLNLPKLRPVGSLLSGEERGLIPLDAVKLGVAGALRRANNCDVPTTAALTAHAVAPGQVNSHGQCSHAQQQKKSGNGSNLVHVGCLSNRAEKDASVQTVGNPITGSSITQSVTLIGAAGMP